MLKILDNKILQFYARFILLILTYLCHYFESSIEFSAFPCFILMYTSNCSFKVHDKIAGYEGFTSSIYYEWNAAV